MAQTAPPACRSPSLAWGKQSSCCKTSGVCNSCKPPLYFFLLSVFYGANSLGSGSRTGRPLLRCVVLCQLKRHLLIVCLECFFFPTISLHFATRSVAICKVSQCRSLAIFSQWLRPIFLLGHHEYSNEHPPSSSARLSLIPYPRSYSTC